MQRQGVQRKLAAILAADVVGYSRLMGADEEGTLERLKALRRDVIDPLNAEYGGRVFKTAGDGILIEFSSAVDAVRHAIASQDAMRTSNGAGPESGSAMALRIGINVGDVIVEDDDLYGDGVNVAARLQEVATPGGICVSADVFRQVRGRISCAFEDMGERTLKNIAEPVRVYRVGGEATGTAGIAAPPTGRTVPSADGGDAASAPAETPSIAVLPFVNMSGDAEQEYFSDGLTEDIITDLSKVSGLMVIARNSSFVYKGRAVNANAVSRELGVGFVLEGSVRKAGNRVRVTGQLIDGASGGHVWAERYDRDLTDIFAVQDDITRQIVGALTVRLTREDRQRLARKGTANVEAYEHFLRGRDDVMRATREANRTGKASLARAIALDPGYAAAYAILAHAHYLDYVNRWSGDPQKSLEETRALAQKAVTLDRAEPWAHWVAGIVHSQDDDFDAANAAVRKALDLDPNFVHAHISLGVGLLWTGKPHESLDILERAMALDPHGPDVTLHFQARALFMMGRYEDAIAVLKRRLIRNPESDLSRVLMAASYGQLGKTEEAGAAWAEALRVNPAYTLEDRKEFLAPEEHARMVEGLAKAGLAG